jgi:phenylalanyl-tRNA synthetase alpha chain
MIDKKTLIEKLLNELKKANNETQIIEIRNSFFNTNISPLYKELTSLPNDQKAENGKIINEIKVEATEIVSQYIKKQKDEQDAKQHVVDYDISIDTTDLSCGALNPISLVFKDILSYFQSLNFTIQSGEEIMDQKYNFDNLNIPKTHPTRETSETFYTKDKSLRTQNTASSAEFIDKNPNNEIRIANFGYVYRNDEDDQTHSHQFNQIDFI